MERSANSFKTVALSSLGSALEYYDFVIYAISAGAISKEFFPSQSPVTSLFSTFLVFAGGYVVRPIGGVFFSHIGDRYGRKQAFLGSILVMSITMFAMALVPNYSTWGVAATVLFTCLRLVQGFSLGGEVPSAVTTVVESIPKRSVFGCALIMASMGVGVILANSASTALLFVLPAEYTHLTWRFAFAIGGALGFVSWMLRKNMLQKAATVPVSASVAQRMPFIELIKLYPGRVVAGMGIAAIVAIYSSLQFVYFPAYLARVLNYDPKYVSICLTTCYVIGPLATLTFGVFGDWVQPKYIYRTGIVIVLLGAIPAFHALIAHTADLRIMLFSFSVVGSIMTSTYCWMLADLFPKEIRCTGIAVTYNISFVIFGGFTPAIVTGLIQSSDNIAAPGYYLTGVAVIAGIAVMFIPRLSGNLRREAGLPSRESDTQTSAVHAAS